MNDSVINYNAIKGLIISLKNCFVEDLVYTFSFFRDWDNFDVLFDLDNSVFEVTKALMNALI